MAEQNISMGSDAVPKPAAYRGAMVQNRGAMEDLVDTGAQKAGKSAASAQSTKFGGQADNVMTLETDAAAPNSKGAQKVQIQVIGGDVAAESKVDVNYADALAISVPDSTPKETLQKLNTAISAQSDACAFNVDDEKCAITDGQLFVNSFFVVNFRATISADASGKGSSISFFRDSGDDLAAAKFLGDVKAAVLGEAAAQSLIALDTNVEEMDVKMDGDDEAAKEKMAVMDALHADDEVAVEMGGATEQYLTQKLLEAQALSKDNTIEKAKLVEALCESEVLAHSDVAVVRASTLILANLVEGFAKEIVSAETLEVISGALSTANVLARRFLVRLLSAMATAKSECDWKMAKAKTEAMIDAVKAVQTELAAMKGVEVKQSEFAGVDCAAVLKKLEA